MQVNIEVKKNKATIWCLYKGQIEKREYMAEQQNTVNATAIVTLIEALQHLIRPSVLALDIDNNYLAGALKQNLPKIWIQNNWKTAKGKEVAHIKEWRYLVELLDKHIYEAQNMNMRWQNMNKTEMEQEEIKR